MLPLVVALMGGQAPGKAMGYGADTIDCSVKTDTVEFTDEAARRVRVSAGYTTEEPGFDRLHLAYKAVYFNGDLASGGGFCTHPDGAWSRLVVTLGAGDDRARLDARRPRIGAEVRKLPRFVQALLIGGRGEDELRGHGGLDRMRGGRGNDRLNLAVGSGPDEADCGAGRDKVITDGDDAITGCEIAVLHTHTSSSTSRQAPSRS